MVRLTDPAVGLILAAGRAGLPEPTLMLHAQFRCWLVLTCLALAAGCHSGPMASDSLPDAGHAVAPIQSGDAHKLGYSIQWSQDMAVPVGAEFSSTVLGDMLVLFEARSHIATAISLRDGSTLWRKVVGQATDRFFAPLLWQNYILINSEQQLFYLDVKTGKVVRKADLNAVVFSGGWVAGTGMIFGTVDGRALSIDLDSEQPRWAFQLAGQVVARAQSLEHDVVIADAMGQYTMLNIDTGDLVWKRKAWGSIVAEPVLTNVGSYVASTDHQLYAVNRYTGQDRWIYRAPVALTKSPMVAGQSVLLTIPKQSLVALEQATGKTIWTLPFEATPVTVREQALLVHDGKKLLSVDVATGKPIVDVPVTGVKAVLPGPANSLLIIGDGGWVTRLDPRS